MATIENNEVYSSITVPDSLSYAEIRYAWQDYPQCGIFNDENLPTPPFSTLRLMD